MSVLYPVTSSVERRHPTPSDGNPPSFISYLTWDAHDRVVQTIDGLGEATDRAYDPQGRPVVEIRPDDTFVTWQYDGLGRLLRQTEPENLEVRWHYTDNADDQVVTYTDRLGSSTSTVYDGLGRPVLRVYPDSSEERFVYDRAGHLDSLELPGGRELTHTYDSAGRLLGRTLMAGGTPVAESFEYDGLGRTKKSVRGGVTTHLGYDSEVKEGGAVLASYGYDAQDRRIERTVAGVSYRTVWSGWRPIEEYEVQADGSEELISRRVYGVGLDEILRLEQRLPGSPPESLTTYYPLYDATSSLVALLDETGKPVERYQYSPYATAREVRKCRNPRVAFPLNQYSSSSGSR